MRCDNIVCLQHIVYDIKNIYQNSFSTNSDKTKTLIAKDHAPCIDFICLRGYYTLTTNKHVLYSYLKIINTSLKNDMCIL